MKKIIQIRENSIRENSILQAFGPKELCCRTCETHIEIGEDYWYFSEGREDDFFCSKSCLLYKLLEENGIYVVEDKLY